MPPLSFHYPTAIEGGGVTHTYLTMMDFLPTLMEIAGTQHPGAGTFHGREIKAIQGRSAWPHFTGKTNTVHDDTYAVGWSGRGQSGALIRGKLQAHKDTATGRPRQSGLEFVPSA